jgi:hypothetical protein
MELDLRIIQQNEFLKMMPSGEIDLEQSKRLLLRLAALNKPPACRDVLLDCRTTNTRLSVTNVIELVRVMIDHRESFRNKLAILTQPGPQRELARFIQLYAGNRGFQVAAFDDFESAILWLVTITPYQPRDG